LGLILSNSTAAARGSFSFPIPRYVTIRELDPVDKRQRHLHIEPLHREHNPYLDSKLREGNRRCFFPQPDFQVPQEEVCQLTGQNMVIPSRVSPNFVLIHPQFRFGFFEVLPMKYR
jgi:hypothetical protein